MEKVPPAARPQDRGAVVCDQRGTGRKRGATVQPREPLASRSPPASTHPSLSCWGRATAPVAGVVGTAGSPLSSLSPGPARTEITTRSRSGPTGSQTRGSCGEAGGDPRSGDPRPGKGFTARFLQPRGCGRELSGRRLLRFLPPLPSRPGPRTPVPHRTLPRGPPREGQARAHHCGSSLDPRFPGSASASTSLILGPRLLPSSSGRDLTWYRKCHEEPGGGFRSQAPGSAEPPPSSPSGPRCPSS